MLHKTGGLKYGYNEICNMDELYSSMLMDVGVYKLKKDQNQVCLDKEKESAFLILDGKILIKWQDREEVVERRSVFDEEPWCLHVPKNVEVTIEAMDDCEVLVEKTTNDKVFESKVYDRSNCRSDIFGDGVLGGTSRRVVRTIFDYSNAPYSNLVIGEVINYPGKWSSYIPHHHPQPEVYYYKFSKPQGFGCSIIGDDVYKIEQDSAAIIEGGLVHPQATAPGYAMYYCWMIRHLDNNPWTDRINEEKHEWLLEKDAVIWPDKE
ncbi:5-deoxy-glucuronate isomerase [Anaeromicrobium sediminis]|uniref:5-deoxyglucuronate isomerase n=1 Tax=Anaeromicrobium sediminis TaxID=1478221 RepID=A0A267MHG0_9FIRM|nr:5-deoxy-glucuronate isomerase [Anaeromicrobium sediminis]PAB58243.1 5-deoxyglucuronate isomerase [Anaeromicrobium sediminis]